MENYRYPVHDSSPGLGTAALVLGICSILLFMTGLSFITGALGILFALLSRGSGPMETSPKAGMILSIIGVALATVILGAAILLLRSGALDSYREQIQKLYEYYIDDTDENWGLFDDAPPAMLDSSVSSAITPTKWEFFEGDVL